MILPVIIITFVLTFPLSNVFCCGGQTMEGGLNDNKSMVTCSYERNSIYYSADSISDNIPDGEENNKTFEGVTQEQFESFRGEISEFFQGVETHRIEQETLFSKILDLIIYIAGFLLFFLLIELLRYIYKFFKMFF